ncbi:hypothetical protein FLONG3_4820 [Fusarium longipes]|uniref:Uncharacterized protein n=1 Tax=Fusarium longipes TaxID=694270 RepID=A0A395SX67_9HYPO|nr:hypothetical protein FLONG3_4820 [Fusarium longipes]
MTRLPRAERLPLVARKDIRDYWENTRGDHEQRLSEVLGQPWTVVVDPLALYPYAEGTWCERSLGQAIASYVESFVRRLEEFIGLDGNETVDEINEICSAHVLTIDYDDTDTVHYCGLKVSPEGQFVILFSRYDMGTNIIGVASENNLVKALNSAPSPRPMNFVARASIRNSYKSRIGEIGEKLKNMLGQEISLVPNFETNFEKLNGSADADSGWDRSFGNIHLAYFEGLAEQLEYQKFSEDDMLRDVLFEAMDKRAVHIRVVDQTKRSYNEPVIEDGILYLQTTPRNFASNTSQAASDLTSIL